MSRVSPGLLLIGFFGVLLSLAVVYGVRKNFQRPVVAAPAQSPRLQTIILASGDLPEGRAVKSSDFYSLKLTPEQFAKGTWPPLMMVDGKQLLNRIIKRPMKRGQPFEPDSFYPEGSGPNVADRLADGLRGFPIDVPSEGVPNRITPGNKVDVIFRSTPTEDGLVPEITRTLVSAVEVLSIGGNTTRGLITLVDSKLKTQQVILAVSADDAMRLKVTQGHGDFSLVLRNENEGLVETGNQSGLSLADVLGLPPVVEPEPPAVEPPPIVTETFRRGNRQVTVFSPDGITRLSSNRGSSITRRPNATGGISPATSGGEPSTPVSPSDATLQESDAMPGTADTDQESIDERPADRGRISKPYKPSQLGLGSRVSGFELALSGDSDN